MRRRGDLSPDAVRTLRFAAGFMCVFVVVVTVILVWVTIPLRVWSAGAMAVVIFVGGAVPLFLAARKQVDDV